MPLHEVASEATEHGFGRPLKPLPRVPIDLRQPAQLGQRHKNLSCFVLLSGSSSFSTLPTCLRSLIRPCTSAKVVGAYPCAVFGCVECSTIRGDECVHYDQRKGEHALDLRVRQRHLRSSQTYLRGDIEAFSLKLPHREREDFSSLTGEQHLYAEEAGRRDMPKGRKKKWYAWRPVLPSIPSRERSPWPRKSPQHHASQLTTPHPPPLALFLRPHLAW
mmetsp:Transcript_9065/g.19713  ORF Transcript_9065/g.19713 Transcript_9065/m.19713 type:complete len:218 (+) Transcript_9065:231-884(+)